MTAEVNIYVINIWNLLAKYGLEKYCTSTDKFSLVQLMLLKLYDSDGDFMEVVYTLLRTVCKKRTLTVCLSYASHTIYANGRKKNDWAYSRIGPNKNKPKSLKTAEKMEKASAEGHSSTGNSLHKTPKIRIKRTRTWQLGLITQYSLPKRYGNVAVLHFHMKLTNGSLSDESQYYGYGAMIITAMERSVWCSSLVVKVLVWKSERWTGDI